MKALGNFSIFSADFRAFCRMPAGMYKNGGQIRCCQPVCPPPYSECFFHAPESDFQFLLTAQPCGKLIRSALFDPLMVLGSGREHNIAGELIMVSTASCTPPMMKRARA